MKQSKAMPMQYLAWITLFIVCNGVAIAGIIFKWPSLIFINILLLIAFTQRPK
jgi:hypothetical protein